MAVRLRCPKCQHRWNYKGKLKLATCPSCQLKVNAKKYIMKPKISKAV